MQRTSRAGTAAAALGLVLLIAAIGIGWRTIRKAAPPQDPVVTEAVPGEAAAPARAGEGTPSTTQPADKEAAAAPPPATPPPPEQRRLFQDPRFDEVLTLPSAPAEQQVQALPPADAPATVLRPSQAAEAPRAEQPALPVRPPPRPEAAQPVAQPQRTATTQPSFEDRRGPLVERQVQPTGTEPAVTVRGSEAPPTPDSVQPPQPFADPRALTPAVPGQPAERREQVQRNPNGQLIVRREGDGAAPAPPAPPPPRFIDTRSPLIEPSAAPAAAAPQAPARVTAVATLAPPLEACPPALIGNEPLDGGRMLVRIASVCRAGQTVRFGYGNATIERQLDQAGTLEVTLDLFAGTASPIEIVLADGSSRELPARANDLDKVEKVALIWRAPVDLDLHVFEYGAAFGQPGHVWSQAASSALAAREQTSTSRRGRGFLSRADAGHGPGDKIEVYTFFRHPEQSAGAISFAVDHATRGETPSGAACGTGAQAEVRFETVVVARGRVVREAGVLASAPCGAPLSPEVRFGLIHQLRIGR